MEELSRSLLKPNPQQPQRSDDPLIGWSSSSPHVIKINTDAFISHQKAGLGALFRNHIGKALLVTARKCKSESPREAELKAIQMALVEARWQGWGHLIIESNCKIAVEALSKASPPQDWSCWSLFYYFIGLCNFFVTMCLVGGRSGRRERNE